MGSSSSLFDVFIEALFNLFCFSSSELSKKPSDESSSTSTSCSALAIFQWYARRFLLLRRGLAAPPVLSRPPTPPPPVLSRPVGLPTLSRPVNGAEHSTALEPKFSRAHASLPVVSWRVFQSNSASMRVCAGLSQYTALLIMPRSKSYAVPPSPPPRVLTDDLRRY